MVIGLVAIGNHVIFTWILRHIGIHGNTVVDKEAKDALNDINVHIILILHSKELSIFIVDF
jgi:ribonuclease HI